MTNEAKIKDIYHISSGYNTRTLPNHKDSFQPLIKEHFAISSYSLLITVL